MPEWLYEDGIGEARAILFEGERLIEARIELPGLRCGTVTEARLRADKRAELPDGSEVLLDAVPRGLTEGARIAVRITREPIPEPGRLKPAKARVTDEPVSPGPDLLARLHATGLPVRHCQPHEPDRFEPLGWSEVLEEAATGDIAFPGGALRLSPTPAMTLFDVDGSGPLAPLALAAASAVGAAILRHDIGGSVGIDFPTLAGKAERQAIGAAIDAALPQPFERTALNGFGFLQIVRPRFRPSLPELLAADRGAAEARALLRRIEREPVGSPTTHTVPPRIWRALEAHPIWVETLARRTGRAHRFETHA